MVDYEDGVEKEELKSGRDKLAEQYADMEKQQKKKWLVIVLYFFYAILGIGAFYAVFYFLWREIQSWLS